MNTKHLNEIKSVLEKYNLENNSDLAFDLNMLVENILSNSEKEFKANLINQYRRSQYTQGKL